jgi:hypothetical protein
MYASVSDYIMLDIRDKTLPAFRSLMEMGNPGNTVVHTSPTSYLPFRCYDVNGRFQQYVLHTEKMNIYALELIGRGDLLDTAGDLPREVRSVWLVCPIWKVGDADMDFMREVSFWFVMRGWRLTFVQHHYFNIKHLFFARLTR